MNSTLSQPEPATEGGPVRLPAHGTTVTAEELRVQLVLAADYGGRIEIDASGVESVGQAVLQLLLAARAEAERAGIPFKIVNPSSAFVERIDACRLAEALGLETQKDEVL